MTKLHSKRQDARSSSMHVGVMTPTSQGAIWTRLVQPERNNLPAGAARAILGLTFRDIDRSRIHELIVKNQEDALTPEEQTELDNFLQVSYLLDLLHSKARRSLKKRSAKK
jgi:hypothetical protein